MISRTGGYIPEADCPKLMRPDLLTHRQRMLERHLGWPIVLWPGGHFAGNCFVAGL